MTVTTQSMQVEGGWLVTVHISGPESSSDLPPLALVHGVGGTVASNFAELQPRIVRSRSTIGIDLDARPGRPMELEDLVAQVAAGISLASPDVPVDLLGYSMGAVVCAAVAARHPHLVRRLILVGGWAAPDTYRGLRSDIWSELLSIDARLLARFWIYTAYGHLYLASRKSAEIEAMVGAFKWSPAAPEQMRMSRAVDIIDDLPRVAAPTLVVGGTLDQTIPFTHSEALAAGIPNSRLEALVSGHAIPTERPVDLLNLIQEFTGEASREVA